MLKSLTTENIGPAQRLTLDLAKRLNLLTGDNGLGKSFLLDVAWWVLTRKWPHDLNENLTSGYPARPSDANTPATIQFSLTTAGAKTVSYTSTYDRAEQSWVGRSGRPWNPGLVVYAHADGGFSVWDPARNYWKKKGDMDVQERMPGYVFSPKDVWDGLDREIDGKKNRVCNGLVYDWAMWIRERGNNASVMEKILSKLSPDGEVLKVGSLIRVSIEDARDIPTITMPYANSVPILHAASGIRRIVGLAYMLLWSWLEHQRASELMGQEPTGTVVLLIDELESHLHPRWQRTILRSLLAIVKELHSDAEIQLVAATHSPLILASAETTFDSAQDAWFDMDLENHEVMLRKRNFIVRGEVGNWLTGYAFDLKHARSLEAEKAIDQALAVMREAKPIRRAVLDADEALRQARLPDIDPFWVRWSSFVEKTKKHKQ